MLPDSWAVTHHPLKAEIAQFVDCIDNGREPHFKVTDAVKTHEICLASQISARENRPVRLPLAAAAEEEV